MTGEPVQIDGSGQAVRLQPPARRADARRNRDKVLAAARAAFAEGGETSMAAVARRAGVGMATLYRNFPGRRELLEAVYADEVATALEAARAAAAADDPGAALAGWARSFFAFARAKRDVVAELLAQPGHDAAGIGEGREALVAAVRPLLARAQAAGRARADLTIEQVVDLVLAVAAVRGPAEHVEPLLETVLDGLVRPG
ncbi:TetR/AcrR family transcriptional regulator [Vallicoccus soli]|uniref:TetR/AcrR family transcriptional regulator n=1 Tax=Vallicoccus soli TaxID=2339232 RepID=A0A3A3Z285_9ACTN|nr:TetR/AcrR family transcriptional regulator [Vallicoccus soli]RJK97492.1 TetR/AcrR family transcriptional regulator [Vallicoccus soli]